MPLNSHPPVLDAATFSAKRQAAERESYTDFALWGGLTPESLDNLPELAAAGVIGFKAFMSSSGIAEFTSPDDLTLYEGMQKARELGLIVALHAESDSITNGLSRRIRAAGKTGVRDYLLSRPAIAEVEAVNRALLLAGETGAKIHLVHLSTGRAVTLAAEAKLRGVDVSVETCPHFLSFTGEDMERLGAVLKCAPPLRGQHEVDALWNALQTGMIDTIGSDHSPSTLDLKEREDFFDVWGGVAGVQSTLAVLLTEGRSRGLTLPQIVRLLSLNPAERFGLTRKGKLDIGADADIIFVELDAEWTHTAADLQTRWKYSPYIGQHVPGKSAPNPAARPDGVRRQPVSESTARPPAQTRPQRPSHSPQPTAHNPGDPVTFKQLGQTRSVVNPEYALLTPETFIRTQVMGWTNTACIIHIAPVIGQGARFTQYTAEMNAGGEAAATRPGIQRFVFVLGGEIELRVGGETHKLGEYDYAYLPADTAHSLHAQQAARVSVFEKRFQPHPDDLAAPKLFIGNERQIDGTAFEGDPDLQARKLLPDEAQFRFHRHHHELRARRDAALRGGALHGTRPADAGRRRAFTAWASAFCP